MATYYSDMVNRRTCVYRCYDAGGQLLYVGLSMHPDQRLYAHRNKAWWPLVDEITIKWFDGREAAKSEEREALANEGAIHNVARPLAQPRIRVIQ